MNEEKSTEKDRKGAAKDTDLKTPRWWSVKDWMGEIVSIKTQNETIEANLEAMESWGVVVKLPKFYRAVPWSEIKDIRRNL